jgi:hypothetical protein
MAKSVKLIQCPRDALISALVVTALIPDIAQFKTGVLQT